MKTVWKYPAMLNDEFSLKLPYGAEGLCVQLQNGIPTMWILVNPDEDVYEDRKFLCRGTGHPIECEIRYIGTYQASTLVFHIFEDVS